MRAKMVTPGERGSGAPVNSVRQTTAARPFERLPGSLYSDGVERDEAAHAVDRDGPEGRLGAVRWAALAQVREPALAGVSRALSSEPAERVLDQILRSMRGASRDERAALTETIFGVALWRRRLAWHAGLPDVAPAPTDAPLLIFALLRDLAGLAEDDAAALAGVAAPFPPRRSTPEALRSAPLSPIGSPTRSRAKSARTPPRSATR